MLTPHVLLPLEGARLRPGTLVDVDHHRLELDGGLDLDQELLVRCLDDRAFRLRVVDLEFGTATTRYLLEVVEPVALTPLRPRRHRPVTTDQTAFLLRALAREAAATGSTFVPEVVR